jgi:hypothetical protein
MHPVREDFVWKMATRRQDDDAASVGSVDTQELVNRLVRAARSRSSQVLTVAAAGAAFVAGRTVSHAQETSDGVRSAKIPVEIVDD